MSTSSRGYAFLADLAYNDSLQIGSVFPSNGEAFEVIEISRNSLTGYCGVIFKNTSTDELIVAHRGTEPATWQDLLTDAGMAVQEINIQREDAYELVEQALRMSDGFPVRVAGHSLGGSLAQICAARYGLYGETVNAYGAMDLIHSVHPSAVIINHARATDLISSTSQHFGEVRVYAHPQDDSLLQWIGGVISPELYAVYGLALEETHSAKIFYDNDYILNENGRSQYELSKNWFDWYRAQLRETADFLESIAPFPNIPGLIYRERPLPTSLHLGTTGVDQFAGSDGADWMIGHEGDDLLSGGLEADSIYGGIGDDTLRGGNDDDHLFGESDNDYLNGGSGNDKLYGGAGNDQYDFSTADFRADPGSSDLISDSDREGMLTIDGVQMVVGERIGENAWRSSDGEFRLSIAYMSVGLMLIIEHEETGSTILIENWNDGMFGMYLGGEVEEPVTDRGEIFGGGNDSGDVRDVQGGQGIDRADESHKFVGNAGNDGLVGGYADDVLEGGDGNDYLSGGGGADRISGGSGNDYIVNFDGYHTWARWIQVLRDGAYTTIPIEQYISELAAENSGIYSYGNAWYLWANGAQSGDATQFYQSVDTATWITSYDTNAAAHPDEGDVIDAGEGSDIVFGGRGADIISGGEGNDVLTGGRDGDYISGDGGDDVIYGDRIYGNLDQNWHNGIETVTGNDLLFGGDGNDKIYGQGGSDTMFGGTGNDLLLGDRYSDDPNAAIEITEAAGDDYIDGGDGDDQILGNAGNDTLLGGAGVDLIQGDDIATPASAHGDDTIDAGAGNDTVWGGGGGDTIRGGDGDDILSGDYDPSQLPLANHGNDMIFGDAGNDTLIGGGGNDYLDGGADDDVIGGEEGDDRLVGGAGADQLVGGIGNDALDGGESNDTLWGEAGDDRLQGGAGVDELIAGDGNDTLDGGIGNDKLWGDVGDDRLSGSDGADELQGGDGADSLDGGNGDDKLWGDAGNDALSGGSGQDQLAGGIGDDTIDGGEDDDILNGHDGHDTLRGGADHDNMSGNAGNDQLFGDAGNDSLFGNEGTDTLLGGQGDDYLHGGAGNDTYRFDGEFGTDVAAELGAANSGSDTFIFGGGISAADTLWTYNGNDLVILYGREEHGIFVTWRNRVTLKDYALSEGRHSILFEDGSIRLHGGSGADSLQGGGGNDDLNGLGGDDIIEAGAGDDRIEGGTGNDTAYGGAGDDTYYDVESIVENAGDGIDTAVINSLNGSEFVLPDNVENLEARFGSSVYGVMYKGNALNNDVTVVSSANYTIIDGGEGADHMRYAGATWATPVIFKIDNVGDTVEIIGTPAEVTVMSTLGGSYAMQDFVDKYFTSTTDDTNVTGNGMDNWIEARTAGAGSVLAGGLGNDTYVVNDVRTVVESTNGGYDRIEYVGGATADLRNTSHVEALTLTSSGTGYGNDSNNRLSFKTVGQYGPSGTLYGEGGDDYIEGGYWDDVLYGGDGNDELRGGIRASGSSTTSGRDILDGGAGDDIMRGGHGVDTYYVDSAGDVVIDDEGWGDQVYASVDYIIPVGVEILQLTGAAVAATGRDYSDSLIGNDLDNILTGGRGSDQLSGGAGADTYIYNVGDGTDVIHENENASDEIDILKFGIGIASDDVQVRRSTTDGTYIQLGDQKIYIFDGNEYGHGHDLNEQSRVEEIHFADGTVWNVDEVTVINAAPVIGHQVDDQELVLGQPYSLTLPSNTFINDAGEALTLSVENLPEWLSFDPGTQAFSGIPPVGAFPYHQLRMTATDTWGQSVNMYFYLTVFNPIDGTEGADSLTGTDNPDLITGFGGNDVLNGGYAADRMLGGAGDDSYTVDDQLDVVTESADQGNDLVNASVSYVLSDNVERLTLTGASAIDGTGNALANTLIGNGKVNTLTGNAGDDTLDGKAGADTLIGGTGNDTYVIDNVGDAVIEVAGEGRDKVDSNKSYVLGEHVEDLTLSSSSVIDGTGNSADNILTGNSANNRLTGLAGNDTLDGKAGADTMIGGLGDDLYVVDNAGDLTQEDASAGIDVVQSNRAWTLGNHIETLVLTGTGAIAGTGNTLNNVLTGNSGNNALSALAGHDILEGKGGTDTLTGGAGSDLYLMARTYASDTVVENDTTAGNRDIARFLTGVGYDQLWFKRQSGSNNLEISIIGTTDKLVIKDWYLGGQYRVEEIQTVDGSKLLYAADVQALVNAMAGMTPPAQGQTTLSPSQRAALAPVFASTWRDQPAGVQMISSGQPATMVSDRDSTMETANGWVPVMAGGSMPVEYAWMEGAHSLIPIDGPIGDPPPVPIILAPPPNGFGADDYMTSGSCGLYGSTSVGNLSDCHRLIDMMALDDRFGRERSLFSNQYGLHIEYMIP